MIYYFNMYIFWDDMVCVNQVQPGSPGRGPRELREGRNSKTTCVWQKFEHGFTRHSVVIVLKICFFWKIMCWVSVLNTLPKTKITPDNRPSQKETNLPPIHFQVPCKLQGCIFSVVREPDLSSAQWRHHSLRSSTESESDSDCSGG